MAVWDTAYVNRLPDSAFALVRAGGTKDADGKTVPRELRMFPYKDAGGAVDLPHLRNALARLPQAKITAEERSRAQAKLASAAKAAGVGQESAVPDDGPGTWHVCEGETAALGVPFAGARIDKEAGIIRDMALLGPVSQNGYTYSRTAMEQAAKLYEGVRFFVDHPAGHAATQANAVRDFGALAGMVRNVRLAGDRVRGDVHLLKGDPLAERVLRVAEQMPDLVGASHRADVLLRRDRPVSGGPSRVVVESVRKVFGVDLVTAPATVQSVFESQRDLFSGAEDDMDLTTLTAEALRAARPDLVGALVEEAAHGDELETLRAENTDLKTKLDAATVAERLRARKDLVAQKLAEAKLPEAAVTDLFRAQLIEAKDEAAIAQLIEDRRKVAGAAIGSRTVSRERRMATEEMVAETEYAAIAKKLGCQLVAVSE